MHFSQFGGQTPASESAPMHGYQQLWFSLARRRWSSVVLVPAHGGASSARLATSLAEVGGRLRDSPVTAIVADAIDYESVRMLTDLQLRVTDNRKNAEALDQETLRRISLLTTDLQTRSVTLSLVRGDRVEQAAPTDPGDREAESTRVPPVREAQPMPPAGQVIVSIPPVVVEPLGVAIAHAADAVVLCIEIGKTTLKSARRTIELIGADRITGTFLIR